MADDGKTGDLDVHVFLDDSVTEAGLSSTVAALVAAAAGDGPPPRVGRIHPYAKSFSLIAPPRVVAALEQSPQVRSVRSNAEADPYPKPVGSRILD